MVEKLLTLGGKEEGGKGRMEREGRGRPEEQQGGGREQENV